jgi:hypothetical protein
MPVLAMIVALYMSTAGYQVELIQVLSCSTFVKSY